MVPSHDAHGHEVWACCVDNRLALSDAPDLTLHTCKILKPISVILHETPPTFAQGRACFNREARRMQSDK